MIFTFEIKKTNIIRHFDNKPFSVHLGQCPFNEKKTKPCTEFINSYYLIEKYVPRKALVGIKFKLNQFQSKSGGANNFHTFGIKINAIA